MKNKEIDDVDLKLLRILQNDARASVKAIAKELYISAPTVKTRIDDMTKKGIIKGYYTDIDNSIFENVIKCYIEIEVSPVLKDELYKVLNESPQVLECDRVTGEYSLIAKVIFKNTVEMDKFINTLQHFGRTRTQIIFSSIINRRKIIQ